MEIRDFVNPVIAVIESKRGTELIRTAVVVCWIRS